MNNRKLVFHNTSRLFEQAESTNLNIFSTSIKDSFISPTLLDIESKMLNSQLNITPNNQNLSKQDQTKVAHKNSTLHTKDSLNLAATQLSVNVNPTPSKNGNYNSDMLKTPLHSKIEFPTNFDTASLTLVNNYSSLKTLQQTPAKATKNNDTTIQSLSQKAKIDSHKSKLHEWIVAYRHAFPKFSFYFDGVPDNLTKSLSTAVKSLSAKVESFFSVNEVTHVIIPEIFPNSLEKSQTGSNVLAAAQKFGLKIWTVDKLLNRVLKYLLPSHQAANIQESKILGKRNLSEIIQKEKLSSRGTLSAKGISGIDFYYFQYYYILIEDLDHLHRSILANEYPPPEKGEEIGWPKLYYVPKGRCPFVRYDDSTSSKDSDSDSNSNFDSEKNVLSQKDDECEYSEDQTTSDNSQSENFTNSVENKKNLAQNQQGIADLMENNELIWPKNAQLLNAVGSSHVIDSVASGAVALNSITSTSTINRPYPYDKNTHIQNLNNQVQSRVDQLSRLEQPIRPSADLSNNNKQLNQPQISNNVNYTKSVNKSQLTLANSANNLERKIKPHPRLNLPATQSKKPTTQSRQTLVSRPGYCENCKLKYDDMLNHIESSSHQAFANDDSNWAELDLLLDSVKRPLAKNKLPLPLVDFDYTKRLCKSNSHLSKSFSSVSSAAQSTFNFLENNANIAASTQPLALQNSIKSNLGNHFTKNLSQPVTNFGFNYNGTPNNPIVIMETSSNGITESEQLTQVSLTPNLLNYTPHASYYSNGAMAQSCEYQHQISTRSSSQRFHSNFKHSKVQFIPSDLQNLSNISTSFANSSNFNIKLKKSNHAMLSNDNAFLMPTSNLLQGNCNHILLNSPQTGNYAKENICNNKNSIMLTPAIQNIDNDQSATTLVNQTFALKDLNTFNNLSNIDFLTPTKVSNPLREKNQSCDNILYNLNSTSLDQCQNSNLNSTKNNDPSPWLIDQRNLTTFSKNNTQEYCGNYTGANTIASNTPMLDLEGDRSTSY
ncbi:hypothetical protein BB561_005443 [Smittium simulii]|uniref:DBF4-type domain-containing protein n=1 Tax=Smittium simulii TaxID=133385 RepID=A0A2T9YAC9_9FUNG|nr:hypothetical protein BB561_005443 [Smittium simulii]